ncbi:uncharacterized protein K02A2.6-like [Eupeodes corollae]|uniref:uncharacterized protein K02A2.6-like n=1 Tax=Eupeodes corollae TaxID=290404 RepID=UPI002490C9B3|nr:uncharacterized protein K02A2.6-like [Eupeodes corollae]
MNLEGKFRNVFSEELGAHKGSSVSLEILPGSNPIFLKHRQCPIAWKPAVETEIEKLVQQKILEPIMFSRWAKPIVPVPKSDGSVRICGDYRSTVNAVIKTNAYPLPTVSEVMVAISDGKVFTKLYLQQAYQQPVVDDASAELLSLNTHKGLYNVRRLHFGVSAAPDLFQKFMDSLLVGIKGVKAYLDDIIVSGKDESGHKCNLEAVFEKLSKANVTVNKNKCLFAKRELDFLGFHISRDGISPNKEKVRPIQQAPIPENKEMLQSFLGLLNFYNSFLPHKSSVAQKLHRLFDKKMERNSLLIRAVSPTYQNQILKLLYGYHPEINLMKAYSRSYVWWLNLDKQIELEVQRCDQCQTNKGNPPAAPRTFIKPPEDPWNTSHIDFAGPFQGHTFLVKVEPMSKWLEVKIVRNMSSTEVKNKLREQFYTLNGIKYNSTAPYHQSSNVQAERMVQYLKTSLKTISEGDMQTKLQRVLFKQNTTPNTTTGKTPAELLMGRRLRTALDAMHPDDGEINPVNSDSSFGQLYSNIETEKATEVLERVKRDEDMAQHTTTTEPPRHHPCHLNGQDMER